MRCRRAAQRAAGGRIGACESDANSRQAGMGNGVKKITTGAMLQCCSNVPCNATCWRMVQHWRAQGGVVFGGRRFRQCMCALRLRAVCAALGGAILRCDWLNARHFVRKSRIVTLTQYRLSRLVVISRLERDETRAERTDVLQRQTVQI